MMDTHDDEVRFVNISLGSVHSSYPDMVNLWGFPSLWVISEVATIGQSSDFGL